MDNDPATLITELAKRGDLDSLLCKVGRYMFREERNIARRGRGRARRIGNQTLNPYVVEDEKERIPVVVIWQIFECRESSRAPFSSLARLVLAGEVLTQ